MKWQDALLRAAVAALLALAAGLTESHRPRSLTGVVSGLAPAAAAPLVPFGSRLSSPDRTPSRVLTA